MEVSVLPGSLSGRVTIPASKSHTVRALVIATLAEGKSLLRDPLYSADTQACADVCRRFGADILMEDDVWEVEGTGGKPEVPDDIIDVRNSGTTLYIALGMAGLCNGWSFFTGDDQIRKRPAGALLDSLNDLGAHSFSSRANGLPPIAVKGVLKGGSTTIVCPTSQYLSSLLISCPLASGDTTIEVPTLNEKPYVRMTLSWLSGQGIRLSNDNLSRFVIPGGQSYTPFDKYIPADFSSATFFLCAAALTGSTITLEGLDMNDSQGDKLVVDILKEMGCRIDVEDKSLLVKGGTLSGGEFDLNSIPDALPALAVTACFAKGTTRLYNVAQARLKETDRISVMCAELKKMGADIEELPDGLVVRESPLCGTRVHGHYDHRVVMALVIAGLGASGTTIVESAEAVGITFPSFFTLLDSVRKSFS